MTPSINDILRGPHIKRLLVSAGSPLIEIEPLRYIRLRKQKLGPMVACQKDAMR
jgi:hypothetical protein